MDEKSQRELLATLADIRNWLRAAAYKPVRSLLEEALPDAKSRLAYQMFDGTNTVKQIRIACKMSPNAVVALSSQCVAMGLMATTDDNKRMRVFDLNDFNLLPDIGPSKA